MSQQHTPLVVGNWKLNPTTLEAAKKLFLAVRTGLPRTTLTTVAIAPPLPFITELARLSARSRIQLGAQSVFPVNSGAHTGEVSLPMLESVGINMVIVGHSERRARGLTNEEIRDALATLSKSTVTSILCVGETKRDKEGHYYSVVENQLRSALALVPKVKLNRLVIAYEPVWAIGSGKQATPEDVYEMKLFIQKVIAQLFGRSAIPKVRILYGGSVVAAGVEDLLTVGQMDGFLVGGASLKPKEFISIINSTEKNGKKTAKN